jgi:8-amino-7-oxononanoate synthase
VTSVILGDPDPTVRAARLCAEAGVRVGCFRPPSVPDGRSRLRLTARADLDERDFSRVSEVLRRISKSITGPDQLKERSGQPSVV